MSGALFSKSEFDCLSNAVEFLSGTRLEPGVESVLEGYVFSAGFYAGQNEDADRYLEIVNGVSGDLIYLDSVYVSSDLEKSVKGEVMSICSDAYVSIVRGGVTRGIDPVLDQPYDTRKKNVSEAISVADNYY
jgi:hypothetical protein